MNNVNKQAFILSAELSILSKEENAVRTEELDSLLKTSGLSYTKVEGKYKGVSETSFYVLGEYSSNAFIKNIANEFSQESYLRIFYDGHVELVYPSSDAVEPIGVWTAIDASVAHEYASTTLLNNVLYSVV